MAEGEMITALILPDEEQFKHDIEAINRFQKVVHTTMIPDQDYGIIPGTQKPTLLKPGAEKIAKLLGLSDQYEILDNVEDWDKPLFRYLIKCKLIHLATDALISEGLGECNSMESKYRWRDSKRKCPECGTEAIIKGKEEYGGGWICFRKAGGCGAKWNDGASEIEDQKIGRVENEDIYSQVNTILKMAKKRALVDAALSAGRLSDIFTQDIEDTGIKESKTALVRQQKVETPSSQTKTPEPKINMDWLRESLESLNWADCGKWLREKYGVTGQSVSTVIVKLTQQQAEEFVAEVQRRLDTTRTQEGQQDELFND